MGFGSSSQQSSNSSNQNSQSYNQAYPYLQGALGNEVSYASKGNSAIADLLGLNGTPAQSAGFDNYKNNSGYNFVQNEGLKSINANNASKGLLGSGSALKAITNYSSGLASTYLDKYLSNLFNLSDSGYKAGSLLAQAGNTANSQGTSTGSSSGSSFNASLG